MTDCGVSWSPQQWGPAAIITHYSFLCLSSSLGLASTSDSVCLYLCLWLCPCLCFYSCLSLSLYRWPYLYISSLYFCLSLFLSHLSFDSVPVPDSITSLSIHISMSLLSVNPGYDSMVKSLEDSRFEWNCPHSLNIWAFSPQLVGSTVWGGLGGSALLEEVCYWW